MKKMNLLLVAAAALTLSAGLDSARGASLTLTVDDNNNDGYGMTVSSQNFGDNYVAAGYHSSYSVPYLIGAFRFAALTIPKNTVISSAYLRVSAYVSGTGSSSFTIAGEAYDNTSAFNYTPYIGARTITSATVAWSVPSAWAEDGTYTSPNIKSIVQEIVNRSGWSSGNAIAIQLRNAASSGGYQLIYSKLGADTYGGTPAQLIVEFAGTDVPDGVKSQYYIPGATNSPSQFPLYLNNPTMYYPDASGGLCWASANTDIFAYWDRVAYGGVKYWNLIDNGTAPLRQPSLPAAPGHEEADVKTTVAWLAHQYYGLGRTDEDVMLEEYANQTNGLSFNATYHGPASSTADRTTCLGTIKTEINAGRPISIGSWGTYFGGGHQVPVLGYKEMSNTVNSTVYIHRNTGGTQSEFVNFYASSWGNLDMDQLVPGGTPVDHYEAAVDNTSATTVTINPDDVYNFRQTHNFSVAGDVDWIRLSTVSGRQYVITTTNLGASCDTVVGVYAGDGTTQIVQDDDGGAVSKASKAVWRCWTTGTHFIRVSDKLGGSGHAANYDVQVSYSAITNVAPTNVTVSALSIAENQASGSVVGTVGAADPDYGNTFTFTLVTGTGSGDNGSFTLTGSQLKTAAVFDYEAKSSYAIRLRATDQSGLYFEKAFTVTVLNVAETCVVTFNPQGGSVSPASATVTNGLTYGALPTPVRAGFTFAGWWTGAGGTGSQVTSGTTVTATSAHTLYAKWTANVYTVTFNAQGGTTPSPTSKSVTFASTYGTLATTTRTRYSFVGWYTNATFTGAAVTAATTVTIPASHTVYAKWSQVSTVNGTPCAWLDQYGLAAGGDYETADVGDQDGDGMLTWEEYIAGTAPNSRSSVLRAEFVSAGGVNRIRWSPDLTGAVPARVYAIYGSSNLVSGFSTSPASNNIPAGAAIPMQSFGPLRFFKVGVGIQ